jgi:dolichol-phosphate mannosyltransferase
MATHPTLTVVLPVYNEGANLPRWYAEARPHLPPGTVVRIVYDFDEDDTLPVARAMARDGAPFELLRNPKRGVASALVTGLRSSKEGPVLVSMADLSDDLAIVPAMVAAHARGAKVVVASRYMPGGRQIGGPWFKGQLSRWGGVSLRRLARFPVHDATNSFRLYDAELIHSLTLESSGGFEIGFEITLKAWMRGETIVELPATWRDRTHGSSRFNLRKWLPLYGRLWLEALRFGLRGEGPHD